MTSFQPDATIRAARPDDVPKILSLISPFVSAGKLLPRTLEEICDLVPTGFVAERDDRIVGFSALEIYSKKLAEIRSLAVSADQQKQGLGSQLVKACVDLAVTRNILEVMVVTSSEAFFRDCGFDFTLPGEKKALFIQPTFSQHPSSGAWMDLH
jgi:amino-acid N-acetyltransferase